MWQANKIGIIALVSGLVLLGAVYALLQEKNEQQAQQILASGLCALLFAVATGTWLAVRRDLAKLQQRQDAPPADDEEETPEEEE